MGAIVFICPKCGIKIEAEESDSGGVAQCPNCDCIVMIPMPGIHPGLELGGFVIEERLGSGGMGEVWLANQKAMDRKVAIKILSPALTKDRDFVERFMKEVKTSAKLDHPNIVTAYDAGFDKGIYYLAVSYIEGVELGIKLKMEGAIPEKEALKIIRGVAKGLEYAWNKFKILHRDIKPENIMIDADGISKLMDMGISKSLSEEKSLTMTGVVVGTPYYMSPEQGRSDKEIDFHTDIYSLGSTLYHLVSGQVPYDGESAMSIIAKHITEPFPPPRLKNQNLSEECSALLEIMMSKKPENRQKSWEDAIYDIDQVLNGEFPRTKRPVVGDSMIMQATSSQALSRRKLFKSFSPGKKSSILKYAAIAVLVSILAIAGIVISVGRFKETKQVFPEKSGLKQEAKTGAEEDKHRVEELHKAEKEKADNYEKKIVELWDFAENFAEKALKDKNNFDVAIANFEKIQSNLKGTKYELMANIEIARLKNEVKILENEKNRLSNERELAERKKLESEKLAADEKKKSEELVQKQKDGLLTDCASEIVKGDFVSALQKYNSNPQKNTFPELGKTLENLVNEDSLVMETFKNDIGKTINLGLSGGKKNEVKILKISDGKLFTEMKMGSTVVKEKYSADKLSFAEQLKRLSSVDKSAGVMKSLAEMMKQKDFQSAEILIKDCGVLSGALTKAIVNAQSDKINSQAEGEYSRLIQKIGIRKNDLKAEDISDEVLKLKLDPKKSKEFSKLVEDFLAKYAATEFCKDKMKILGALEDVLNMGEQKDFDKRFGGITEEARTSHDIGPGGNMGSGGFPTPTMEQAMERTSRMLNIIRSGQQTKPQTLERIKERMTAHGIMDTDTHLAEIGKIIDEAMAMTAADFEQQQQQLVSRIMTQMRGEGGGGRQTLGGSGSSSPGGEGSAVFRLATVQPANAIKWIDVHDHLIPDRKDPAGAVNAALSLMDRAGISKMIVLPPPQDGNHPSFDADFFITALRTYPSRFAFLSGGGVLNSMLQQAGKQTTVSASLKREFEQKANAILKQGASGFGEMAAHHLSLHGTDHPYESVPADHPLLLLLADIAAKNDVPIDIHLDAVTDDMQKPDWLESPLNPKIFHSNIAAFERLLDHNPKAKICWAHAGSDNLGQWTTSLSRRLLKKHPNLYMSLRMGPAHAPENYPLNSDGQIKPDWLSLLQDFPTRFVIGSDRFIASESSQGSGLGMQLASKGKQWHGESIQVFLNAIPPDLARKIASENAIALYKLKN